MKNLLFSKFYLYFHSKDLITKKYPFLKRIIAFGFNDHKVLQEKIRIILGEYGYEVRQEELIFVNPTRNGRIDVTAYKPNEKIGIEIDYSTIREKSVQKLSNFNPDLAIFILRAPRINKIRNWQRLKSVKINYVVLDLFHKKIQLLRVQKGFFQNIC